MARLTKRVVDAAAPGDAEIVIWDAELSGFGLRVYPSGRKTYVAKYRNASGRQRWLTLGTHGTLTPDQARKLAQERLGEVRHGSDPVEERKRTRGAATVGALLDRYLSDHVAVRNKPRTQEEVRRLVENQIRPRLGALPVQSITIDDVARFHAAMGATRRQANLALACLSKAMSLAETWRLRPKGSNPCREVERFPEVARDRFLAAEELPQLGAALRGAEGREHPRAIAAILLLLLTGRRLSEVCTLRWDAVDLKRGSVRLADTKAGGPQHHALNGGAMKVLERIDRVAGSPWVLPMIADPKRPMPTATVQQAWQRIRAAAGLPDVRLHDLRHTVATYAARTGGNAFLIRDLLGHKTIAMASRYVSRDVEPVRLIAEGVGAQIADGLGLGRSAASPGPVASAAVYDPATDVLTIRFAEGAIGEPSEEGGGGLRTWRNAGGRIVGFEIGNARASLAADVDMGPVLDAAEPDAPVVAVPSAVKAKASGKKPVPTNAKSPGRKARRN